MHIFARARIYIYIYVSFGEWCVGVWLLSKCFCFILLGAFRKFSGSGGVPAPCHMIGVRVRDLYRGYVGGPYTRDSKKPQPKNCPKGLRSTKMNLDPSL